MQNRSKPVAYSPRSRDPLRSLRRRPPVALRVVAMLLAGLVTGVAVAAGWSDVAPGSPSSDAWNYLAAGERLLAGHHLYELSPGDRPVEIIPPYWSIPLLAPPPVALAWVPLAPLGDSAMGIWITGCVLSALGIVAWVLRRGSTMALIALVALSPALAMTALAGNVNAYLAALLALSWLHRDRRWLPALSVVTATSVKLTPIALAPWLLLDRRWVYAAGFAGAILGVSLLLVPGAWSSWLDATPGSAPSPYSLAGRLGLPAATVGVAVLAIAMLVAVFFRRREAVVFGVGILAAILASPAVYFTSWSLLAAVLVLSPADVAEPTPARSPDSVLVVRTPA